MQDLCQNSGFAGRLRRAARFMPTFFRQKMPKTDWKLIPIGFWISERRQRTIIETCGVPSRNRTYTLAVNSRLLYLLSYWHILGGGFYSLPPFLIILYQIFNYLSSIFFKISKIFSTSYALPFQFSLLCFSSSNRMSLSVAYNSFGVP